MTTTVTILTWCGQRITGAVVADRPAAITLRIAGLDVIVPRSRIADVTVRSITTA